MELENQEKAYQNISSEIICVFKTNLADKFKIDDA